MSVYILAIDTSGPRLNLALRKGDTCEVLSENIARGHAEIIFDRIDQLMGRLSMSYADLTAIAVTTGPGSFTGLRVGLASARGIGLAQNIPVIGVPSLMGMSLGVSETGEFAIACDARREQAYFQIFSSPGEPKDQAHLLALDEVEPAAKDITLIRDPVIDPATLSKFAMDADPTAFPPDPLYVRAADAKPQLGFAVARQSTGQSQ